MMARLRNLSTHVPQRSDLKAVVELIMTADDDASLCQEDLEEEVRSAWQSDTFSLQCDAWIIVNQRAQVVGYADVHQEREGCLRANIYVHPIYRGRGVGTLLLLLVEKRAREQRQAICRELHATLGLSVNSANQGAKDFLEREGYLPSRSFWRLVLDTGKFMPNSSSSNQGKLRIDMVLDEEHAADTMQWNRYNGVSFVQHYTVYQKELRPGINATTLDESPFPNISKPSSMCRKM